MTQSKRFLPYGRQVIDQSDIDAVVQVLRSDYLTTGPCVPALEKAMCDTLGADQAVAVANGTAALHLVSLAAGAGPGTSVIVPTLTFVATANAPNLTGAEIVFADVDADTGLLTPDSLEAALTRANNPIRLVFAVHIAGQTCDMPALARICKRIGADLIEDACHALGTRTALNGSVETVGACHHARAATFSLHPVKTIAAGEGGIITTQDTALSEQIRLLRNHGIVRDPSLFEIHEQGFDKPKNPDTPNPWYYEMPEPGFNYRLSDIHAALATSQLRKLREFARVRHELAAAYDRRLASSSRLATLVQPAPRVTNCKPVRHLYQVLIDFAQAGVTRQELINRLHAEGIGTQVHYLPVHRQPYYRRLQPDLKLKGADTFYARTLSLPLFASMTPADADRVIDNLEYCLSGPATK